MLKYVQIGLTNKNQGITQCNTPTRSDASGWMNRLSVLERMMVQVVTTIFKNMIPKLAEEVGDEKEAPNFITLPMKIFFVSQPQLWAHDQGKGLRRCEPRGEPGSHISCSWECKRM